MAFMRTMPHYTFDAALQLKDAGLVAADAGATVATVAKILDLGDAIFSGIVVIDITAVETDSSNEGYRICLQGSNVAAMTSGVVNLAEQTHGHSSIIPGGGGTTLVGRYLMPFVNIQADVTYRYVRLYTDVAGTLATGINYSAFIGKTRAA